MAFIEIPPVPLPQRMLENRVQPPPVLLSELFSSLIVA
jgi:hypothetical protein